ncbi:MAG: recombinase RecT [Fusobacteriaceae bacterium]
MTETTKATNSLQKREVSQSKKTIFDVIKAGKENFALALPKHINSERFIRVALTQIRMNPQLAGCSQESLLGALMTSASLGLEPGVLGQVYLIPFKNSKLGTIECQLQISYKGMIEMLRRTKQLKDIYAYPVYSNDEFSIEYGLDRTMTHKPNFIDRGEVTGFYSVAILNEGIKAFEYMTKSEVIEHETKYRKGNYKNSIWDKNFEEMALKTVTKKMLKWLPVSVEVLENMRKEDNIQKFNEVTKEVEEEEYINIVEEEEKATDKEISELIKNSMVVKLDIQKHGKDNGYDFDDLSKKDLEELQKIIDDEIEKNI